MNINDVESYKKALEGIGSEKFRNDFSSMLRTRYPLFYVTTSEEPRLIQFLDYFCAARGYECYLWDSYNGLYRLSDRTCVGGTSEDLKSNPLAILDYIISEARTYEGNALTMKEYKDKGCNGIVYVLLDFFRFMVENPDIERRFKALSGISSITSTILTGPYYTATDTLENIIPVLDFPIANKEEIKRALHDVSDGVSIGLPDIPYSTKRMEEDLINAARGLTIAEAQLAFSKSIVSHHGWHIPTILEGKKQIIGKSGILEYFESSVSLDDVGGLDNFIEWIKNRKVSFSEEAAAYGLKKPRGVMAIGTPGSGKSLVCKAISSAWGMPLLRLDFGRLFGSLVGDSERNVRKAIKLAEAHAPCILWIDEIEKAISGISSSGSSDGGTTSRVLSTFLTWMQEKDSPVFVVATANDHQSIPPEFLRAGRFDEVFFVDFPYKHEREEIFKVLLRLRGIDHSSFNIKLLAERSENYSGAEIEKSIDNAMLVGFTDNKRPICTDDILDALRGFKPLYEMRKNDFEELREWADSQCLKANSNAEEKISLAHGKKRNIDV